MVLLRVAAASVRRCGRVHDGDALESCLVHERLENPFGWLIVNLLVHAVSRSALSDVFEVPLNDRGFLVPAHGIHRLQIRLSISFNHN